MAARRARTSARMAGARMTDPGTRGGFTIIEVVLVLAIAGLIFLMVFIALPALQRSQRDTQRRQDLGRITDAITQYQTNNNGRLPATGSVNYCKSDTMAENDADGTVALPESTSKASGCSLIRNYLNSVKASDNEFTDPDGPAYGIIIDTYDSIVGGAESFMPPYDYNAYIITTAACNGDSPIKASNSRSYAIMYRLEGSGVYCQDNGGGAAGATSTD